MVCKGRLLPGAVGFSTQPACLGDDRPHSAHPWDREKVSYYVGSLWGCATFSAGMPGPLSGLPGRTLFLATTQISLFCRAGLADGILGLAFGHLSETGSEVALAERVSLVK